MEAALRSKMFYRSCQHLGVSASEFLSKLLWLLSNEEGEVCGRSLWAHHSRSLWNMHPCDPGHRRNLDSQYCCFSGVSLGDVLPAVCRCCSPRRRPRRPSCQPASRANCFWTGCCSSTGCCSTAAAGSLKTTGWPWTACPEWPPVCWETQAADCNNTTQP